MYRQELIDAYEVWDKDDVARVQRSLLEEGTPYKYLEMPMASYSFQHTDRVLDGHRLAPAPYAQAVRQFKANAGQPAT